MIRSIDERCSNPIQSGRHKLNGTKVAIKAIHTKAYLRLEEENGIDEAAMELCDDSHRIVNLLEMFKQDGWYFIVSKYAYGGDLLRYCLKHSNSHED